MDPFIDIRLFQRVSELGSIRSAAREAGVEPSSVSRRMTRLESRLGTKLLERAQNQTRLTDAGVRYYEHMRTLLPQIDAVENDVAGEAELPKGTLKVNAAIDFGQRHVAQWLLAFQERYAAVDVELSLSSRHVDLVAEGVDVAIRVGQLRDSSLKARRLAVVPRVLVAAPAYLARHGVPREPADLEEHAHIFYAAGDRRRPLVLIDGRGQEHRIDRKGKVTINAVYSLVEAVKRGCGIHAGPRWAFQNAIDCGEVVELLSEYKQHAMPMSAIWAPAAIVPARVRAFIDVAASEVRKIPGLEY